MTNDGDGERREGRAAVERLRDAAAAQGLGLIGGFAVAEADAAPDGATSLFLLGYDGPAMWRSFSVSDEYEDGERHPLDRWTKRVGDDIASAVDGAAVYPFGVDPAGKPWPFLRWAMRAEAAWSSPIGLLVSAERGLWSSYRLAIGLKGPDAASTFPTRAAERPCDTCAGQPCRTACPVGAFSDAGYDVDACTAHLRSPEGADCLSLGCRARRACPVGADRAHQPDQAAFHMRAFLAARRAS